MAREDDNERDNVSLLDSIFDQFGLNIRTQGRQKALTHAFYNSMSVILIVVCAIAVGCVFIILEPFIKPLCWAVVVGSVLHPIKFKLSTFFKKWLYHLEKSNKPITLEIISLPCFVLLTLSNFVGNIVISKIGLCILGIFGGSISIFWLHEYTPETVVNSSWMCFKWTQLILCFFLDLFESSWIVTMLLCTYLTAVFTLYNGKKDSFLYVLSCVTWFGCACYIAGCFNYLRLPVLLFFLTVTLVGVWNETSGNQNKDYEVIATGTDLKSREADSWSSRNEQITNDKILNGSKNEKDNFVQESPIKSENNENDTTIRDVSIADNGIKSDDTCEEEDDDDEDVVDASPDISRWLQSPHTSDLYIYLVALCCVVFIVFTNLWLLYIIAFLLLVYTIKCFFLGFGLWLLVQEFWDRLDRLEGWYSTRRDLLIPLPVAAFFKTMGIIKCFILRSLQDFCDAAASVTVILGLLGLVIIVSIFLCIQMYTECFYMVKVSGQVINQTVVHNPELMQSIPEGWEEQLDSVLNNAYTYGREWLKKMLHSLIRDDIPPEKSEGIVQTVLELWDRTYQYWIASTLEKQSMGPKVTSTAVFDSWGRFVNGFQKTPELISIDRIKSLLMDNMAVLSSSFDSLWLIVKGNVSLLFYGVTTFFSVIIGHGAALLGFFINMIIFLTALFYLLNSSRELYKPVEILTNMIPQYGNTLAVAMETAAKEVLVASFKMTIFYGLWTWFIHSLFVGNIVYIPSVLAAMLAVVPVLGTYWACIPGVLDLWLAQGKGFHAILLAVFQFLPTTVVDTAIYNDIHGGHPYLTGLAVAGGVLYLGAEGAIIGPLALCGLLVVINLSSGLLKESAPSPPHMSPESST